MAWFAMNNWGLFPMNVLSKAKKTEEEDEGSLPVRQLRGAQMVDGPRGKMPDPESPKFQRYDPKRYEAEYRAIVAQYGVSSKEARHFHLRNRSGLATTLSDGVTNHPDKHTDYTSVYGDKVKSNARLAHVQGSGKPSDKDVRFHAKHANSSLDADPELHDAISDYAHKLQNFIQRAYTTAAGRGGSAGGKTHGANVEQVVAQLVNKKYKKSAMTTPSTARSDDEEASVEDALKDIMGAKAHEHVLATAGPVLRALQKAKEAAKKVKGADGKPLDLYKDRLFTNPAYFHEIFSKVGTTNPTDAPLTSHHQDAAEWGKAAKGKRPIDDYYGFLERLKPGEKVPVTATQKAGYKEKMLTGQRNQDTSRVVTESVKVNPATDMMAPEDRGDAKSGSREVERRIYDSPTETFTSGGRDITVPGGVHERGGQSHIGVSRDISSSHGGEDAPITQGFEGLTKRHDIGPGEIRSVGLDTVTAISGPHQGYNPDDDDFAPGSGNLRDVQAFRAAPNAELSSGRLGGDGTRLHRVVSPRGGNAETGTSFKRPRADLDGDILKRTKLDGPEYEKKP